MAKQTNQTGNEESIPEEQLSGSNNEQEKQELTLDKVGQILMSIDERLKILELKTGLRTY